MFTAELNSYMGHVDEIDGMRAIAVAAVLAFHAFPGLVPGGYIGVDIFFVISGFIITRIYYDKLITKRTSLSEFYARRIRRLMPVYLFVILFSTIGAYFVLDPPLLKNYSESLAAQVVYLQNFAFWVQGSYFAVPLSKPLLHTWSLAVEEQFYLIYAIPVLLARWWPKAALVLILLIASLSYAVGDVLAVVSPKTNFFLLPARIWEFALGFGVARLAAARRLAPRPLLPLRLVPGHVVGLGELGDLIVLCEDLSCEVDGGQRAGRGRVWRRCEWFYQRTMVRHDNRSD